MKKKVIIFEDNRSFGDSLKALINASEDMECLEVYTDPRFALEAISKHHPDMILMDIDMPYLNGIEGVKMIRMSHPSLPIVIQTVFDQDDKIYESIISGANGYILKKTSPKKYIEAIRNVLKGGSPMSEYIAGRVLKLLQNPPRKKGNEFNLSEREIEVLRALVDGLSYKMIADRFEISYNTVNTHIKRIYSKLHVHNATEAVSKTLKNRLLE